MTSTSNFHQPYFKMSAELNHEECMVFILSCLADATCISNGYMHVKMFYGENQYNSF